MFGLDIACNAASALYFFPLNILLDNRMGLDDSTRLRIYEIYSREMINIHLGQGMDIVWQSGKADMQAIGELDYMQMGALKTGTLPRLAARLGAALCKADKAVEIHLAEFAESLGIGFQIYDDVLNLTCSNGKNQFTSEYLGSDISEGKISLIIIHAIKQGIRIKRLQEIISLHTRDKSLIDEAIAILRRNGSIEYAAARSKSIIHEGWNKLHAFFHDCGDIRMLDEFVEFINRRDH